MLGCYRRKVSTSGTHEEVLLIRHPSDGPQDAGAGIAPRPLPDQLIVPGRCPDEGYGGEEYELGTVQAGEKRAMEEEEEHRGWDGEVQVEARIGEAARLGLRSG